MHKGTANKAVFIPRDDAADRAAQKALQDAHNSLIEARRLARLAGWGGNIRDDMEAAEAMVSYVRRGFQ